MSFNTALQEIQGWREKRFYFVSSDNYNGHRYIKVEYNHSSQRLENPILNYERELKEISDLCIENGLIIFGNRFEEVLPDYRCTIPSDLYLVEEIENSNLFRFGINSTGFGTFLNQELDIICCCGRENGAFALVCECGLNLFCTNCRVNPHVEVRVGHISNDVIEFNNNNHGCTICTYNCGSCNSTWTPNPNEHNFSQCYNCYQRFICDSCGEEQNETSSEGICNYCITQRCPGCGEYYEEGENEIVEGIDGEGELCRHCFNQLEANTELFDNDSEMPATRLSIPTIQGRERIRYCGLEIEGINIAYNAHNTIARDLFDLGVSSFDSRRGYHEGSDRYANSFAHIERDSSCDWEAVIGPINMASTTEVRKLNQVIKAIRERIQDKTVKFSLSCGLHIHVSAEKVGIDQAHRLHLLYTYMEDVLYRLGAAKWPYHRAVINGDRSYRVSPRAEKKLDFVNRYLDNRYYGLSFSNYFQRMLNNCACGAGRFGMFDECICTLHKCTFEFRFFNTTANTKKLHAYMALTQALVAKAFSMNNVNTEEMAAMPFNMRNFKDMNSTEQETIQEEWKSRIKFILEELPLTNEERVSILYCIDSSELSSIMNYCDEIVNNQTVEVV